MKERCQISLTSSIFIKPMLNFNLFSIYLHVFNCSFLQKYSKTLHIVEAKLMNL